MAFFRCIGCDQNIPHPLTDDECEHVSGGCKHLVEQGATMVWTRIEDGRGVQVLSRGGWLCATCSKRYGAHALPGQRKAERIARVATLLLEGECGIKR